MSRNRSTVVQGSPTVLVTGAGRGLGHVAAVRLAASGWQVYAGVRNAADAQRMAEKPNVTSVIVDVTNEEHLAKLPSQLPERLDALVSNAGVAVGGPIETLTLDDLRWQLDVNVIGAVGVTQAVLPLIRKAHGRIVFISSTSGRVATPSLGAYGASKFALEAIGDSLRNELRPWGITVSLIEPGPIISRFRENCLPHFERHIDWRSSVHRSSYEGQLARLRHPGPAAPFTLGPEAVVARLLDALENPYPKARYPVTTPAVAFAWLKRFLSTALMDRVLRRASGGGKR